ncbi:MAG: HlyD family secretion protein [Gammaproteobacteria bacterium]|jgi:multidrug resistance efflux pump|nr:HlyD family secretion protein [Gammaproteobacteria bacterium]|tara:strand:- start:8536 stop:9693 length:1158 start_codon:yes stop_codon:yes gene_type:complete
MSDQEEMVIDTVSDDPVQAPATQPATDKSVKKGLLAVVSLIVLTLSWYLFAERFTPYTTQARLEGYIVGVAPQVSGVVREIWVSNNQSVEIGQKLFQIDPTQYEIALAKANSNLESAQRQIDSGNAAVDAARANLVAAKANQQKAEKDAVRLGRLYKGDPGTVSLRRLEVSHASRDQARAGVTGAMAKIEQAIEQKGGDDDSNNGILKSARAAVDKAELDVSRTVVRASTKGLITDLRSDIGLFAATGSPVVTLISLNDLWVSAQFKENNLGHLRRGSPVEILFDALPGKVFEGKVRSVGYGVGSGQASPKPGTLPIINNNRDWLRQSQRFPVIVTFDPLASDEMTRQLRIGGQASVIVYTQGDGFLKTLGRAYMRFMSMMSYAY